MSDEANSVYDVKIEDTGPAAKRLTITVPPEVIGEKIEDSIGTLAVETSLPGFRKGRAPRALLERRFGSAVRTETRNQIIADAYASAIEDNELKPVGEPEAVEKVEDLEIEEGKPLTFSLDIEVVPEFELPEIDGVPIRKPIVEVADEHIDAELDRHRLQNGTPNEIKDGFAEGDRLIGPATVDKKGEDEPIFRHDRVMIVMPGDDNDGQGQVLGLLIDGLKGKLEKTKVGDTITIETTGPEGHEREDIRGAELTINVELREAYHIEPASDDDLVAHYGLDSADTLREQVKLALEQRRDQEQAAVMREQVHEHLLENVDIELPEKLSASQAERALERHRIEMLYRGMEAEAVEDRLAELRNDSDDASRNRLKLFFILHKLGDQLNIEVTEQEINGRIAAMAHSRNERPEKLKQELIQANRIGQIASQIREHKAADRIVHQARIEEVDAEAWNKEVKEKVEARKKANG